MSCNTRPCSASDWLPLLVALVRVYELKVSVKHRGFNMCSTDHVCVYLAVSLYNKQPAVVQIQIQV